MFTKTGPIEKDVATPYHGLNAPNSKYLKNDLGQYVLILKTLQDILLNDPTQINF